MISAFTRPAAATSPSSAVELDLAPSELLPLLGELVSPALVVRCGGISLFRKGSLGNLAGKILTNPPTDSTFPEAFAIVPDSIRRICLLHGAVGGFSLELELASCGFALSIWCGRDRRDREAMRRLLAATTTPPLAIETLDRAGAAAWLDDFPESCPPPCRSRFLFDQESHEVTVSLHSPGFTAATSFIPTFIDRDGGTLRLSDAGGDRVIHVRMESAQSPFPLPIDLHRPRP